MFSIKYVSLKILFNRSNDFSGNKCAHIMNQWTALSEQWNQLLNFIFIHFHCGTAHLDTVTGMYHSYYAH